MDKLKQYFTREKKVFLFLGSGFIGSLLLANHYLFWGSISFFDFFPSHESSGLLFLGLSGLTLFTMFDFKRPQWLIDKNKKKFIGKILEKVLKK